MKSWLKSILEYCKLKRSFRGCHIEFPLKLRGTQFIKLGKKVTIRKNFRIECINSYSQKKMQPELFIGDNVVIGYGFTALVTDALYIGEDSIIAANVMITTENHGMNPEADLSYARQPLSSKAVSIGKNVWVGQNVCILSGVTIGDNVIIGAGSIVTKSIEANTIVGGNPARKIKSYNSEAHQWEKC